MARSPSQTRTPMTNDVRCPAISKFSLGQPGLFRILIKNVPFNVKHMPNRRSVPDLTMMDVDRILCIFWWVRLIVFGHSRCALRHQSDRHDQQNIFVDTRPLRARVFHGRYIIISSDQRRRSSLCLNHPSVKILDVCVGADANV